MFLIRLMYLSSIKKKNTIENDLKNKSSFQKLEIDEKPKVINQIKNISQEEKSNPQFQTETKLEEKMIIQSLDDLIKICSYKKEIKLKYELEKNVNLVKFEKNRIEISFNEKLDKNFIKELSSKLFDWTNERWIITLSQSKGEISITEKKQKIKESLIDGIKNSKVYKDVLDNFPDAELIDINLIREDEHND